MQPCVDAGMDADICFEKFQDLRGAGDLLPLARKLPSFVSTGAQYRAPTSREGTAMKLGPGPKGA